MQNNPPGPAIKFMAQASSLSLWALIIMWTYAVFAKLADFPLYQSQMRQQVFSSTVSVYLVYVVIMLETIVLLCLIIHATKPLGLILSLMMLIGFTFYIALILTGYFPKVPCSCGGLIAKMSWKNHLCFNLIFMGMNLNCLYYSLHYERRLKAQQS